MQGRGQVSVSVAEGRIDAVQGMARWELGAAGDALVVGEERSDGNGGAALGRAGGWGARP